MAVALYPGSFDPLHLGHLGVIERAAAAFEVLVVAVVNNPAKQPLLPVDLRLQLIVESTAHLDNVDCMVHDGLTVDAARRVAADVIVRGASKEMRIEQLMAAMNHEMAALPTCFLPASASTMTVSSSYLRDLVDAGRLDEARSLLPAPVFEVLRQRLAWAG